VSDLSGVHGGLAEGGKEVVDAAKDEREAVVAIELTHVANLADQPFGRVVMSPEPSSDSLSSSLGHSHAAGAHFFAATGLSSTAMDARLEEHAACETGRGGGATRGSLRRQQTKNRVLENPPEGLTSERGLSQALLASPKPVSYGRAQIGGSHVASCEPDGGSPSQGEPGDSDSFCPGQAGGHDNLSGDRN
jgi:hypothetical protein